MKYDVMEMKKIAETLNNRTFTDYFYRLNLIARSVFEWTGLPEGINEKWIERYLFNEGECLFFKHPTLGFIVTKCADGGELNHYDEATILTPVAHNIDCKPLVNHEECVLIQNNDLRLPTAPTIELYAMRLAELSRTIDVNVKAQKTPVLILASEKQKLSMKQVYAKWDGNEPVIYGDKSLDPEGIRVLKTDAPIVFDKLQIQKHAIWNECMTFLGINNANMDKRERLVDDEVQANNEQIAISAEVMLKARQTACEEINKMFGTNIQVQIRKQEAPQLPQTGEVIIE